MMNFNRDQRLTIVTLALCFGAVPLTALNGWVVYLTVYAWRGFDERRLEMLASAALQNTALLFVIEVALAMVLSIRAFKGSVSRAGASFDIDGNGNGDVGGKLQDAGAALVGAGAEIKGAS